MNVSPELARNNGCTSFEPFFRPLNRLQWGGYLSITDKDLENMQKLWKFARLSEKFGQVKDFFVFLVLL